MAENSPKEAERPEEVEEILGPPAPIPRTIILVLAALALSLAICALLGRDELPSDRGTVHGRVAPLVSDGNGRIERFFVQPGDSVRAGDPLAILINEQLIQEIDRCRREVEGIRRALQRAEQSADEELARRLQSLDAEIAALQTEWQDRSLEADSSPDRSIDRLERLKEQRIDAAHRVRASRGIGRIRRELVRSLARLESLEARPVKRTLPAPVSGKVASLLRQPGERVVPGTPLLEVADPNRPYLIVEMPEPTAKRFALGDTIPLKFPTSEHSLGRVANMQRIRPADQEAGSPTEAKGNERRLRLKMQPQNDDWPAMPLQSPVKVRTSQSDALSRRVH